MKFNSRHIISLLSCIVFNNMLMGQCPSDLLFLKAPDSICAGVKELILKTSKAQENNVKYIWILPENDSIITTDSVLIIKKPNSNYSGNYYVATNNGSCSSNPIGPVKVTIVGAQTASDTVKKIQLCGINEVTLSSKFKTSKSVSGKWLGTEGVQIANPTHETTQFKNLNIGKNTLVWVASTEMCPAFVRDSFIVTLEAIPRMDAEILTLNARNASFTIPLSTISGSNLNLIEDVDIKISQLPKQGNITLEDKRLTYSRKVGFRGRDNFSIIVCNNRCPNLCSVPTRFEINVEYEEQYPNVTIPKLLSQQQGNTQGFVIEKIENYPENELHILDRWGGVVEKFSNYNNTNTWAGTHQGKYLPAGAYYYFFYAKKDISTPPKENLKPITGIFYIID